MLVAIAWRNLWRNPGRTVITVLAIAGGLASLLAMYAMVRAMSNRLLEGVTGSSMGHVQVHREGYRSKRGSSRTVAEADVALAAIRGVPGVAGASGRIYGVAHASIVRGDGAAIRAGGGEEVAAPVVALLGVDPEAEASVTDLAEKVREGRWLGGGAEVVVGAGLAKRYGIRLGDGLLPTAVGANGAMRGPWAVSDDVPRVVGVLRSGVEQLDGRVVILPRRYLGALLGLSDRVQEIAIRAEDPEALGTLVPAIRNALADAREGRRDEVPVPASGPLVAARASDGEARPGEDGGVGGGEAGAREVRLRLVGLELPAGGAEPRSGHVAGLEGRPLERAEDLLLARPAAAALSVSPGDRVEVSVPVDCGEGVPAEDCPPSIEPFVVAGVVDADEPLDGRFALLSSQVLTGNIGELAPGSVANLGPEDRAAILALAAGVGGATAEEDEVLPWQELAPELEELLRMMDVAPLIFFMIVYFAVMLGIVNTMLMATFERTRELGLMRAVGMRPSSVVAMVLLEAAFLAGVGVVAAAPLIAPLLWYWQVAGMNMGYFMGEDASFDMSGVTFDARLWPTIVPSDVVLSVLAIGVMTTLSGLWPAIRAARLQPTDALRHE